MYEEDDLVRIWNALHSLKQSLNSQNSDTPDDTKRRDVLTKLNFQGHNTSEVEKWG